MKVAGALWRPCASSVVRSLPDSSSTAKKRMNEEAGAMSAKAFFDSNVLIYAMVSGDSRRERAQHLIAQGGVISVQVLNEFVAVARRKMGMPWGGSNRSAGCSSNLIPFAGFNHAGHARRGTEDRATI